MGIFGTLIRTQVFAYIMEYNMNQLVYFFLSYLVVVKGAHLVQEENPCEGLTLSECNISGRKIVATSSVGAAECQQACSLLNSDYWLDCDIISGLLTADVPVCLGSVAVDPSSCNSIIQETCEYSGEDPLLEAAPGIINDVVSCEVYCEGMQEFGLDVQAFAYNERDHFCKVYNSGYSAACTGVGAPDGAPAIETC